MNYKKCYNLLIEKARNRVNLDCVNDKSNIIPLTAREHYIAHWLLYKIY